MTNLDKPLVVIYRHWRSVVFQILGAIIISGIVFRLSLANDFYGFDLQITENYTVTFPFFLVILLALLIRPVILIFDDRNEIGEHHIRAYSGLCSWKRKFSEIAYENVKGVEVDQNIVERILDVGDVKVWTAISGTPEVVMEGVDNPNRVAAIIRKQLDETKQIERELQEEALETHNRKEANE